MLAKKSDSTELEANNSVCYASICKEALFPFEHVHISLPPAVASLLQEYDDVFPSEIPPGIPPIREIAHQIVLIPAASLLNHAP